MINNKKKSLALKSIEEELVQRTKELETIYDLSLLINQSLDLDSVFQTAIEKALSVTGFEMGAIFLLNEKGDVLQRKSQIGLPRSIFEDGKELKYGEGVSGHAVKLKQPVIASIDEYSSLRPVQEIIKAGIQTLVGFPLQAKGKVVGTISLFSYASRKLSLNEIHLLESIGNQIGIALENAKLFEETKKRLNELTLLQEEIEQSEKKYRTVVENALYGVSIIGTDYRFKYVNEKIADIHGYRREELLNADMRNYLSEESKRLLAYREDHLMRGIKLSPHFDLNIIRKDGDVRNVEISAKAIKDSKGEVHIIVISKDITARKKTEEALQESEGRFRLLVEHSTDAFILHDFEGKILDVNRHACSSLGYTREELLNLSIQDIDPDVITRKHEEIWKQMVPGVPVTLEGIHTRKDGTTFPVEIRVGVFEVGGSKRILGLVRDVTQRKRMEEQLIQSEKLRAVGEMASGVAHDFNNALAVILGNAQLLLHTADNEELRETLKIIEKVAKESAQTVRRLQDFTRKRVHQEFFSLDLNSIIRDSIEISRPRWKDEAQNRGIHIEIVPNLKEIPPVIGNDSELREVIANILFNSIEAMPEGGNIEIQTFQRNGKDYIQISDAGTGMKEEDRKKIFEPFFTTKPFSNAGLGLSMSYGIIKRMGGEIDVESKPGKGTTFTISLPIHFDSKEEMATEPVTPSAPLSVEKTGPRILVIDDEESVRGMLSRMLEQVSHQVHVARNGEEGLQLFHENEFDMVLTDLGMPGMSGWDVCRAVKKMNPWTSVGMITGWGMEISPKQVKESGLDFLISKPFDFKEILRRIEETMESKGI